MKYQLLAIVLLAATGVHCQTLQQPRTIAGTPAVASKNEAQLKAVFNSGKDLGKIFAKGGVDAGGGDDVGMEFQGALMTAVTKLQKEDAATYAKVKNDIDQSLSRANIIVVDDALNIEIKDLIQNSVAVNIPSTGMVLINRARWNGIRDPHLKESISLHEILSLAKLEQTGTYPYTAKYLALQGASLGQFQGAVAINRMKQIVSEQPGAAPFETLKTFFEEAISSASLSDFDSIKNNKLTCQAVSRFRIFGDRGVRSGAKPKDTEVVRVDIAKDSVVTKMAVESRGPLFPGNSEVRETLLNLNLGKAWLAENGFVGATLIQNSGELVEDLPSLRDGNGFAIPLKVSFRRNNSMVAFYIPPNVRADRENENYVETYGYCYRSQN